MRLSRIISLAVVSGLILYLCVGILTSAAHAQSNGSEGVELLARAAKALDAGDYAGAATSLDEAFKAGLSKDLAVRAILIRAEVNERSGKLAYALQDYTNALWMDTLSTSDRKIASDGKQRVMAAMGLSDGSAPGSREAAANRSSSGFLGIFGGLFGSGSADKPPPAPAPPPMASPPTPSTSASVDIVRAAPIAKPAHKVAAAQPKRRAKVAAARPRLAPPRLQPVSTGPQAQSEGGFLIVFGSASNRTAAAARAKQIKAQLAGILVNRNLDIEAGGEALQIVAGPYKARSAALALCSAMRQRGVNCKVSP